MFKSFKKKEPSYPADSRWSVCKGEYSGKLIFFRRNDSATELVGHPDYRFRFGVAVPLKAPNEQGLPTDKETGQLNVIEDILSSRLEAERQSLFVLAITTNGMREFVFYTRNTVASKAAFNRLQSEVTTHELQMYIVEDPEWSVYKQFAK